MTRTWTPTTLVVADDDHDQRYATDGHSRYGAYLHRHLAELHEYDEPTTLLPAPEYAAAAWRIATAPVMSPGYVRIRPDLGAVEVEAADDGSGRLVIAVEVPLLHSALAARLPVSCQEWQRYGTQPGPYESFAAPEDRAPTVLAAARVRVPVAADAVALLTPLHISGPGLVDDARRIVRALVEHVNAAAGPVVAGLREQPRRAA
jgi:hypothetical protein